MPMGKKTWLVADCYWPEVTPEQRQQAYQSHEAICALNTGESDAHLTITLYFEDREPFCGFTAVCPARRTHHVRMDKIRAASGETVTPSTPYAVVVQSDVPVVVQYSRLDATQPNLTLMTTLGYGVE